MTETSKPENAARNARRLVRILGVALIGCVVIIVSGMIKYRVPGPLWRAIRKYNEIPIPSIAHRDEYNKTPPTARLSFPDSIDDGESVRLWQQTAHAKLYELLRPSFDGRVPIARTVSTESVDGVSRETLVLTSFDGIEIPAFLLRPTSKEPRAALLVVPGHSEGIVATAGIRPDYQKSNALVLAQAGYVVLTMEIRGFGYLETMGEGANDIRFDTHVAHCLLRGTTALSVTVSDLNMGFNFLTARPDVLPRKVGVVGFSSGGKAAIYFAALDERVKVVVASGCVMSHDSGLRFSRHDAYEVIPKLALWLEMSDCLGLLAPRPLLVHWGEWDTNREERSAAFNDTALPMFEAARRIYAASGNESNIEKFVTPELGHEFDNEPALEFLARHLPPK